MKYITNVLMLVSLLFVLGSHEIVGQIRNKNTTYLEISGGTPIIIDQQRFLQNWSEGERTYGFGVCFTNAKANYHRIHLHYKQEKITVNAAFYTNAQLKYSYETLLLKGSYHRSFLGLLYGGGVGFELLRNSPNANLSNDKVYPFLTVGLHMEKFISPGFALFLRLDTDATTTAISQRIKANAQIGLKFKLFNVQ